ncbi:HipA N-terminal domain-containing protein [Chitinophaga horti]|uniref:HipA N-terminal domain-containing protein n=1 Tax=Chitinophaga horti TaxID=2920382 RepID=A0ABY6J197_9BACT|nr:HipA N-terminal domain-containing protein [Chitinophaga horti]UYQ92141.1 HipA N-terminal domain-containing protein [Chitinophaga horti]
MREARVYYNRHFAGTLKMLKDGHSLFRYNSDYVEDNSLPSISTSLPKNKIEHRASTLFPFFAGLLTEGEIRQMQVQAHNLDPHDDFSLLAYTASLDTIGAITLKL